MNFHSIFSWALHAVEDQAKKAAITEIQKATANLNDQIGKHAPDMQAAAQSALQTVASHALAGLLSKKG